MKSILSALLMILSLETGIGQIDSLAEELFTKNSTLVPLYLKSCSNNKIDSSVVIRAKQPNSKLVLKYLERILLQNNANNFELLKNTYAKHIKIFEKELGKAYLENHIACDFIKEQYNILSGFETVLWSLDIKKKNLNAHEIFLLYSENLKRYKRLIDELKNRPSIISEFTVYSEIYKELNTPGWFRGSVPFTTWDPYIKELTPLFIETIENCDWNENKGDVNFISQSRNIINKINSSKISNTYIQNFRKIVKLNKVRLVFEYAENQTFETLVRFLIKDLLANNSNYTARYSDFRRTCILILKRNPANREWIKNELLLGLQKNNLIAVKLLANFPDKSILRRLKKQKRKLSTPKILKEELSESIKRIKTLIAASNNR